MNENDKKILEEMRVNSKVENTPENLMYSMLGGAHPAFVEQMELYALRLKKAVGNIAQATKDADNDVDLRTAWEQAIKNHTPAEPENSQPVPEKDPVGDSTK